MGKGEGRGVEIEEMREVGLEGNERRKSMKGLKRGEYGRSREE